MKEHKEESKILEAMRSVDDLMERLKSWQRETGDYSKLTIAPLLYGLTVFQIHRLICFYEEKTGKFARDIGKEND